ncbi:response regulator transcription factor [Flavobacterium sp.]|jgi:DNA-binding NarL/FixJ family response regulator|uniref:response regulator transcription factor n=1 Tax=Flavobacterium sp. TaxID=239 RepID=UPI002A81A20B|nr:response regulator transcription factor [Flavobacterium sp.]
MIKVCIADNHPVVQHGVKSYFNNSDSIEIVATVNDFNALQNTLQSKSIDVIVVELELDGLSSIRDLKSLIKEHPDSKIILYTSVSEKMYAPTAIKAGVSAYLLKTASLKVLETTIIRVSNGVIIFSDEVKKTIEELKKGKKSDRLFKKLSTREIEVLRYLNDGKKNKEIAQILGLDEKTISTYKLRLLAKLSVTNLVDLLNKAKSLEIL